MTRVQNRLLFFSLYLNPQQFTTPILRPFQIVLNALSGVTEAHKSTPYKTIAGRSKTQTRVTNRPDLFELLPQRLKPPVHAKWFMCCCSTPPTQPTQPSLSSSLVTMALLPEFLKKAVGKLKLSSPGA